MYSFSALMSNTCLISVIVAWLLAQIIKIFTGYFSESRFSMRKFFCGTGGMPSSHSATVMALMSSAAVRYGFDSFALAISILLATIVMSDAMGVRYETGKQAKVINELVKEIFSGKATNINQNLKTLIGHTPFQVLMGAALGITVGLAVGLIMR